MYVPRMDKSRTHKISQRAQRRQNNLGGSLGGNLGLGQIKTYFMQRLRKLSQNECLSVLKY